MPTLVITHTTLIEQSDDDDVDNSDNNDVDNADGHAHEKIAVMEEAAADAVAEVALHDSSSDDDGGERMESVA